MRGVDCLHGTLLVLGGEHRIAAFAILPNRPISLCAQRDWRITGAVVQRHDRRTATANNRSTPQKKKARISGLDVRRGAFSLLSDAWFSSLGGTALRFFYS